MSDLPAPVAEAGLLFHRPSVIKDAEAMRQVIAWGHEQIDVAYPEDPIRAPLNVIRRQLAHMEWDRVIRTAGRELRGTIATSIVRELEFEITRRQEQIRADDAEARRRAATTFDAEQRTREHAAMSEINLRLMEAQLRLSHELGQEAEDAASRRRKDERVNDAHQEIAILTAAAVVKTLGTSSAEKTLEATRLVNDEIARIRRNPDLTDDEKHLQIKTLLETLPQMLRGLRSTDV